MLEQAPFKTSKAIVDSIAESIHLSIFASYQTEGS